MAEPLVVTYLLLSIPLSFFENNEISWSMCKVICTDRAATLTGYKKGFRAKVNEITIYY